MPNSVHILFSIDIYPFKSLKRFLYSKSGFLIVAKFRWPVSTFLHVTDVLGSYKFLPPPMFPIAGKSIFSRIKI